MSKSLYNVKIVGGLATHSANKACTHPTRCRKCGVEHNIDEPCKSPASCPNCHQPDHVAGSLKCPQVQAKMEVHSFARAHSISSREASARLKSAHPAPGSLVPPLTSFLSEPTSSAVNPMDKTLKSIEERLSSLESKFTSLKAEVTPVIETHNHIVSLKQSLEQQNNDTKKLLNMLPMIEAMSKRSEEMAQFIASHEDNDPTKRRKGALAGDPTGKA